MDEFEIALEKMIVESEKKLVRAIDQEDFANALTIRAYLNGLQVVSTMYALKKAKEAKHE